MSVFQTAVRRAVLCFVAFLVPLALIAAMNVAMPRPAAAQQPETQPPEAQPPGVLPADGGPSSRAAGAEEGKRAAEAALSADEPPPASDENAETGAAAEGATEINYLELMLAGRWLMLPILVMSILVVTFSVERFLGLRRSKILPPELIAGLGKLAGQKGGLDPRGAYKLAQQYPSAAANVIKTMLLKVGRPHAEVEHTVSEANEREAAKLYANVRWLSLAAGVSPLLGLLGTVWGMIEAFHVTANLPLGANKSVHLAQGIYTALVTTFAGLAVAIPAAVLAHWFEGWIQKLFRELDETLLGLMPQLERFEGRLRVTRDKIDRPGSPLTAGESPTASGDGQEQTTPASAPAPK